MTVCLAALCEHGRTVVVAADRMVTFGGIIEFEHTVPKMAPATTHAMVMVAGDTLIGTTLAQNVSTQIAGTTPSIHAIATELGQQYQATRQHEMEIQLLVPRGLDFGSYYAGHSAFNPQIVVGLDQYLSQFNLGVELLLGGVDGTGSHIYSITNPNQVRCHDIIGHAAVGSGALHALQSFIGFRHDASATLEEAVFRAYASKRRSEAAPGVGRDTDLAIISDAGVRYLNDEDILQLGSMLSEHEAAMIEDLTSQLAELRFSTEHRESIREPQDERAEA